MVSYRVWFPCSQRCVRVVVSDTATVQDVVTEAERAHRAIFKDISLCATKLIEDAAGACIMFDYIALDCCEPCESLFAVCDCVRKEGSTSAKKRRMSVVQNLARSHEGLTGPKVLDWPTTPVRHDVGVEGPRAATLPRTPVHSVVQPFSSPPSPTGLSTVESKNNRKRRKRLRNGGEIDETGSAVSSPQPPETVRDSSQEKNRGKRERQVTSESTVTPERKTKRQRVELLSHDRIEDATNSAELSMSSAIQGDLQKVQDPSSSTTADASNTSVDKKSTKKAGEAGETGSEESREGEATTGEA
eukprot:Rmarinus@m.18363